MQTASTAMDRWKPKKRTPNEEYSLYDNHTGQYSLIRQGFGVCDRTADALNFGLISTDEIGELSDSIRRDTRCPPKMGAD